MVLTVLSKLLGVLIVTFAFPTWGGMKAAFDFGKQEEPYMHRRFWTVFCLFSLEAIVLITLSGYYKDIYSLYKCEAEAARYDRLMSLSPRELSLELDEPISDEDEPTATLLPIGAHIGQGTRYLQLVGNRLIYRTKDGYQLGPKIDDQNVMYVWAEDEGNVLIKQREWVKGEVHTSYWVFYETEEGSVPATWIPAPKSP